MSPGEESSHRLRHAALERTRLHDLSIQQQRRTRAHHTQQGAYRVTAMNEATRCIYIMIKNP